MAFRFSFQISKAKIANACQQNKKKLKIIIVHYIIIINLMFVRLVPGKDSRSRLKSRTTVRLLVGQRAAEDVV